VQAVALSVANETKEDTFISLGIHAGDHAIYPDCRQEFRDADMEAFKIGNWDAERVKFYTPYLDTDKFGILEDGLKACETLNIDFDEVYKRTNTSYKPYPSGNSDYKSASSVERIEAFIKLGRKDPVQYEDETGPVEWEVAKSHVEKVLAEHIK
jgi:7-cyano-7-deazaguanine synthase